MDLADNSRLFETVTDQLETPLLDNRSYSVIRLPNELEALIIHDPDTDKASAALDVNVGSLSDDPSMPGMAHAVEHLLFMGTEKYPKENEYSSYLAANSGHSNASTAATHTNYYFELAAKSESEAADEQGPLHGALDRFAQFFISPLFLEDTLDRELQAVNSEHKKNLQSDPWRLQQLHRSLGNPMHPFSGFSTGSLETLRDGPLSRGVKIRDAFIEFYQEHYSANRMKLVVLGREPLDKLASWVGTMFAAIPNKHLPQYRWDGIAAYAQDQLKTLVLAKPVMSNHSLELRFTYPDETELYESQPARYLGHLIGHEGPGSILAYIKAKGLATGLSAGYRQICPGSALFTINVSLTPLGLTDYEEVVKAIFQYISVLRESQAQQWIYDEIKDMSAVDFRFKQKASASRTTSSLSGAMHDPTPREWLLSGSSLLRKFDAAKINKAIASLTPDNVRVTVVSKDAIPDADEILREKWYGTEYSIKPIPGDFLSELQKASVAAAERPNELHLPGKNEFVPSRLDVERKTVERPTITPKLIRNDTSTRLWYKKDDQFWVPQANLHIVLRNPLCWLTPRAAAMSTGLMRLVQDALGEYAYDAEIAGLDYRLESGSAGIKIVISGYNDKMHVLLEKVLGTLRDLEIKEDRWEIVRDRLIRAYENSEYASPYQQVGLYSHWLADERVYLHEQVLAELPSVQVPDLRAFRPMLLGHLHAECVAHGNLYREDALKLTDMVEKSLHSKAYPTLQHPIRRGLLLPRGSTYHYNRTLKDPSNVNHCIQYILQVGDVRDRPRMARLRLFAQMNEEVAFNQLRTVEQLGYVVFSGALAFRTVSAYQVLIQSERSPDHLESRIESFLRAFRKRLADMSAQDFEGHRRSLINSRLEKVKNLTQETNRYVAHVSSELYFFQEREEDVKHIEPLTKEDMLSFYDEYIDPDGATRSKLAVRLHAQASVPHEAAPSADEQKAKLIELVGQFLSDHGLAVDAAKLNAAFGNVSVGSNSSTDQESVVEALTSFLDSADGVTKERVASILEQGRAAVSQAFVAAGIESASEFSADAAATAEEQEKGRKVHEITEIKDAHAFKASLVATAGAAPVQALSTYEELVGKL